MNDLIYSTATTTKEEESQTRGREDLYTLKEIEEILTKYYTWTLTIS